MRRQLILGGAIAALITTAACSQTAPHAALPVNGCNPPYAGPNPPIVLVDYPNALTCNPQGNSSLRIKMMNNADFDALVGTCNQMYGTTISSYTDTAGRTTILCQVLAQDYADFIVAH